MVDYILFEKKSEGDREPWNKENVVRFCEEQKYDPIMIEEEYPFIVVTLREPKEEGTFRLVEITPSVTFLIQDDPSLDTFLEKETFGERPLSPLSEIVSDTSDLSLDL
jgi:hypothetical protein